MPALQISQLIYKNFFWRIFFYASSLILTIGIARMLGAELSGHFNFFLNDISFFLLIGSFSLESGITYYASKGNADENVLASFSLAWALLASGVICILFYLFYTDNSETFSGSFLLFACVSYIPGILLTTYFSAFFYSHDNYKVSNFIMGVSNLVLFLFIIWGKNWVGTEAIKIFFILFFITGLIQGLLIAVIWFYQYKKKITIRFNIAPELSLMIRYSAKALIGNIAYFLLYRIDYWFVEYYCSAKSLGNYIQVSKLGQLFIIPLLVIAGILFPQSSKENISFQSPVFKKLMGTVSISYIVGSVILFFIGKPLILFFWGSEYDEMYRPLLIMMPGIIFLAISYLFSPLFSGKGKVQYNVYISLATLAVVIICNFLLIPGWGINGAALATSIGFLVMMLLYIIIANKKFGFQFKYLR